MLRCMHRLWLLVLLAPAGLSAAEVYRSVDENGNPVFTDQPSDDAEKIELQEITTIPALQDYPPPSGGVNDQGAGEVYRELSLTSPQPEQTYFRGEGPLPVTIRLEPRLRSGDTVAVFMDGEEILKGRATTYTLPELDRGTHELSVAVMDAHGNILKTSESVTFYMRQASRLTPPARVGPGGG